MRWAIVVGLVVALGASAQAKPHANVVIVIDRSLPVEKLEVVTAALIDALAKMAPEDRIAVVGAGTTPSIEIGLQTIDASKLAPSLARITWSQKANLSAALDKAASIIAPVSAMQRSVLLVTDRTELVPLHATAMALARKGVHVSTLGYQGTNTPQLAELASIGRGDAHAASSRTALADTFAAAGTPPPTPRATAVVFVIDRSGSMAKRFSSAKAVVENAAKSLGPNDRIGIVAVDSESQVVMQLEPPSGNRITVNLSRITTQGGTNLYPGLHDAFEMLKAIGGVDKHVIVISDGETTSDGLPELVTDMHAARIEVSAVGLPGADRNLLQRIAEDGFGRLYMIEDSGALPRIFVKER